MHRVDKALALVYFDSGRLLFQGFPQRCPRCPYGHLTIWFGHLTKRYRCPKLVKVNVNFHGAFEYNKEIINVSKLVIFGGFWTILAGAKKYFGPDSVKKPKMHQHHPCCAHSHRFNLSTKSTLSPVRVLQRNDRRHCTSQHQPQVTAPQVDRW